MESLDHGGEAKTVRLSQFFHAWRSHRKNLVSAGPAAAYDVYADCARSLGLEGLTLFLSFDCDTDLDVGAVEEVHAFLQGRGIKATYAVPGAQLERGAETYRRLSTRDAEFMNHGGRPHAKWKGDHWVGTTFYNEMTESEIVADIHRGDAIVTEIIGRAPRGFRAPHFGCYNAPAQVEVLHRTAAALGYQYCSTTIPRYGLERGPAYLSNGIVEMPCFGSFRNPESILDSWTYLSNRVDYALGDEYYELFADTLAALTQHRIPALLTWYADPCHVLNQKPFVAAIELAARCGVKSLAGSDVAALLRARLAPGR